jgi:hypothetical protein
MLAFHALMMVETRGLIDDRLRQDDATQIGNDIWPDTHLNQARMEGEDIDEFEAHGLDIEARGLAQVKQDLKPLSLEEMSRKVGRARTVVVLLLIKKQHLDEL